MTNGQRERLDNFAGSTAQGRFVDAIRAALAEIDELRKQNAEQNEAYGKLSIRFCEMESRLRGSEEEVKSLYAKRDEMTAIICSRAGEAMQNADAMRHKCAIKDKTIYWMTVEVGKLKKEIVSLKAQFGSESGYREMIAERDERIDALLNRNNALREKLAAPPETAAIVEIHNRLAALEGDVTTILENKYIRNIMAF